MILGERGCRIVMIDSKNTRHTVQLIVGVFLVIYVLLNMNSLSALEGSSDKVPKVVQDATSQLAAIGSKAQGLTENGLLQSLMPDLSLPSSGVSSASESSEVVVDPPTESTVGNIGSKIEEVGVWFVNLWSDGGESMDETIATAQGSEIPDDVVRAREPFGHLSRPYISHVPLSDEDLVRLDQMGAMTDIYE